MFKKRHAITSHKRIRDEDVSKDDHDEGQVSSNDKRSKFEKENGTTVYNSEAKLDSPPEIKDISEFKSKGKYRSRARVGILMKMEKASGDEVMDVASKECVSDSVLENTGQMIEPGPYKLDLKMNREAQIANKRIVQPDNMNSTLIMDMQPDVCKDFQKTGYCGYGDSCKFLHSRDDFKAGWKLNTDWVIDDHNKKLDECIDIPFKCVLCEQDYKSPIVTKCGHYFCNACFLERLRTDKSCFICHKDTQGSAKVASNLKRLLARR